MKDDKAKDATSVDNAPRMTRDETPAAAMAPVATVATATPKEEGKTVGKKAAASKGSAKKGSPRKSAATTAAAPARAAAKQAERPATAARKAKAAKPRAGKSAAESAAAKSAAAKSAAPKSAAGKSPARSKSSPAVASAPKAAVRPAVAKAAVAKAPVDKAPVDNAFAAKPPVATAVVDAKVTETAQKVVDVARKVLPMNPMQAASTALQAALRGPMPSAGVIPTAEAALAPFSAALESGAEQARNVIGRARDTRESLQQAVTHSATAAAHGMLELNGKVIDLLRAQSDAAFELWRSALAAGSLSEAVRVQTSGLRQAYEATATHAKDVAETATRAIGDTVKPLQSAMARTPR
jgi:hypothetical protein